MWVPLVTSASYAMKSAVLLRLYVILSCGRSFVRKLSHFASASAGNIVEYISRKWLSMEVELWFFLVLAPHNISHYFFFFEYRGQKHRYCKQCFILLFKVQSRKRYRTTCVQLNRLHTKFHLSKCHSNLPNSYLSIRSLFFRRYIHLKFVARHKRCTFAFTSNQTILYMT